MRGNWNGEYGGPVAESNTSSYKWNHSRDSPHPLASIQSPPFCISASCILCSASSVQQELHLGGSISDGINCCTICSAVSGSHERGANSALAHLNKLEENVQEVNTMQLKTPFKSEHYILSTFRKSKHQSLKLLIN